MTRLLLWLIGGVLLGGVIHIVVILALPRLDEDTVWTRVSALAPLDTMTVLPPVEAGAPNPLRLDPELVYGVCRLDLAGGPGYVSGTLPDAPWSVAIFDPSGVVGYSTTNRDGIGRTLELGLFNAAQTRLLAQQQLDVAEGVLVVESGSDALFVLVRLLPPQRAMRDRYATLLGAAQCGNRS